MKDTNKKKGRKQQENTSSTTIKLKRNNKSNDADVCRNALEDETEESEIWIECTSL